MADSSRWDVKLRDTTQRRNLNATCKPSTRRAGFAVLALGASQQGNPSQTGTGLQCPSALPRSDMRCLNDIVVGSLSLDRPRAANMCRELGRRHMGFRRS